MRIKIFSLWKNVWVDYLKKYFDSTEHDVEFIIHEQINVKKVEEADVAIFMWANEHVITLSKQRLKYCKKYIVFCRSYEIFYGHINKIKWNNIDDIVFVNPAFAKEYKTLPVKVSFIPNAIDLDKWELQKHSKGFNLAMVAHLNHKKGIDHIPQFMKKLTDIDSRYTLHIAGDIQDARHLLYINHLLEDMGICDNVILHGYINDLQSWLKDKDYLFTCSVTEGHPNNVIEAMSLGIKPLIHNWIGAKDTFPERLVWSDIDSAVKMVTDGYDSTSYRKFIEKNYDMWKVYPKLEELCSL